MPNPSQAATGSQKSGALMPTLASAINAGHAITAGCLVSQAFSDFAENRNLTSHFAQDVTGAAQNLSHRFLWSAPYLSSAHSTALVVIELVRFSQYFSALGMTGPNTEGQIQIRTHVPSLGGVYDYASSSVVGTIYVDGTISENVRATKSITINLPTSVTAERRYYISLSAIMPTYTGTDDDFTSFVINRVQIFANRPQSPLNSGIVDAGGGREFVPIGQGATGSGSPFSAALGLDMLSSLDAVDHRARPLFAYSRRFGTALNDSWLDIFGRSPEISPRGYAVYTTALVRNCPQTITIRYDLTLSLPPSADSTKTYSADLAVAPVSALRFPDHGGDRSGLDTVTVTIPGDSATTVHASGTLSVSTVSAIGPAQDKHVRLGFFSPTNKALAAVVDTISFWVEP